MRTARATATSVTIVILLSGGWMACGGDDSTGLVSGNDAEAGGDATASEGGTGIDTGTANDAGTGGDTGSGSDTGTGNDGATDAGSDAVTDAPSDVQLLLDSSQVVAEAGPGGDAAVISCGSGGCALPSQTCCIYPDNSEFLVACSTGASCPVVFTNPDAGDGGDAGASTAVALQCEIRENCPTNNVCCLVKRTDGTVSSHCTQSCQGGAANAALCDPAAVDAGCDDAGTCSSNGIGTWGLPSGFATCGGRSAQ